jgi:O-antigen/teichoic acid export membrane protein
MATRTGPEQPAWRAYLRGLGLSMAHDSTSHAPPTVLRTNLRTVKAPGARRAGTMTLAATAVALSANLATGIVLARVLGSTGRGELTAILAVAPFVGWIVGLGGGQAVTYHQARRPEEGRALVGTYALLALPLGILAIAAAEAVVHITFSAQTSATRGLAEVFMLTAAGTVVGDVSFGALFGDQDFALYNLQRILQPMATLALYLALSATHRLDVGTALATVAVVGTVATLAGAARVIRRLGIGRPSMRLAQTTLWYGLKAHGTNVAGLMNTRLDMMLLPAFVLAPQIGVYAVAVSVSGMIMSFAGGLSLIVLPMAARRIGDDQSGLVLATMRASAAIAGAVAILLAAVGPSALRLAYGAAFVDSVTPMRLLLPGTVLFVSAGVLVQGLYATNRPFSASLAQFAGLVVTAPGLLFLLPRGGGIMAAALISTFSYAAVFVVAAVLYCRTVNIPLRSLLWRTHPPRVPRADAA